MNLFLLFIKDLILKPVKFLIYFQRIILGLLGNLVSFAWTCATSHAVLVSLARLALQVDLRGQTRVAVHFVGDLVVLVPVVLTTPLK